MITAYVFGNAPAPVWNVARDLRVVWALEETGLPYRLRPLDFARGDLSAPDYLDIHPFGLIPAIDDGGFRLFESAAIVLHLAGKSGRLLPESEAERMRAAQWTFAAVNTVEPALVELFALDHFSAERPWAAERRVELVARAERRLAALENELARRPYLLGDEFGAADLLLSTVLRFVQHTDLLEAFPQVTAHRERCEGRPAWLRALAQQRERLAA